MVLENSSAGSDSFNDTAPASDNDPYSSNSNNPSRGAAAYRLDSAELPHPIPIIGGLMGYNQAFFEKVLSSKFQLGLGALHRPPTKEEADAFAYWTAKQISILSYGTPLGCAAGLWRASSTAGTYAWPFYKVNMETFRPYDGFPSAKIAIVRGLRANYMWHIARAGAYMSLGSFFSKILFASYSLSVATVGELSDKRLKAFIEAVRTQAQQRNGGLSGGVRQPGLQRSPVPARGSASQVDDASPTGGAYESEYTGGMARDESSSQAPSQPYRPSPAWETGPETQQAPSKPDPAWSRTQEPQPAQDEPFGVFDDASPTGGQGGIQPSEASITQGSAWDRLRRGEKSPGPQRPVDNRQQGSWQRQQNDTQREQRDGSSLGDSFTFSKTEEERSLAKSEAQKEFDARVERERRGGDFAKGGGDQKRW